ncbi:ABC transporter permease [Cellulomonas sp. NS3]|uniref:ABC transporter permease n=1 Tax=Cellulomonas sp. NS3 TaxID=2973977 RepID=UPI002163F550|nr:ABC transporter permease [Cellulomonas sp. NS3]
MSVLAGVRRSHARDDVRGADRFSVRDLLTEATYGIGARPGRLVLTILGTVLGIASVVVTVGLAQTAAGQINRQFDAVAATQVVAAPATTRGADGTERATARLPWDAEERAARLAGVEAAGTLAEVDVAGAAVTAVPVNDPSQPAGVAIPVVATSPGLLDAVRGEVVTGRYFDAGHDARADRVVVLGARAAERLGVHRVDRQPSVFIGETSYTVIGIVDGVQRRGELVDAVLLPQGTARADFDLTSPDQLQIRIAVGAGPVVGEQVPVALDPNAPDGFKVQVPPAGSTVRESVQADVNAIFLALGAVALLIGGLGIANVTLLSVMERVGEIGLRRALGATRRDIGAQFVVESVVVGLLGGLIGAAVGVAAVVVVSAVQSWTPILDTVVVLLSALAGGVIGLLAGIYPALKAAAIEPIAALRGGI